MSNNSNNQTILKTETSITNEPTNYLLPIIIVSSILIGIILISVITYLLKIKMKIKSKVEKNHLNQLFKKNYLESKPELSSFSLKISNIGSEKNNYSTSFNKVSNSNINLIKFKNNINNILNFTTLITPEIETQKSVQTLSNINCKEITSSPFKLVNLNGVKSQIICTEIVKILPSIQSKDKMTTSIS